MKNVLPNAGWALFGAIAALPLTAYAVTLNITIELQGAVSTPFERDVAFVATDAEGGVLQTWSESVIFTDGMAQIQLLNAPAQLARLSAKTTYHLRRRVDCAPIDGLAEADFTGAMALRGGDLNGDNVVDMQDFNRLRFFWFSDNEAADLTGSGMTAQADLDILKSNWMETGDEP